MSSGLLAFLYMNGLLVSLMAGVLLTGGLEKSNSTPATFIERCVSLIRTKSLALNKPKVEPKEFKVADLKPEDFQRTFQSISFSMEGQETSREQLSVNLRERLVLKVGSIENPNEQVALRIYPFIERMDSKERIAMGALDLLHERDTSGRMRLHYTNAPDFVQKMEELGVFSSAFYELKRSLEIEFVSLALLTARHKQPHHFKDYTLEEFMRVFPSVY
jgi:hypothetical protein